MTAPAPIPILPDMAPLAARYDAWLSDIWGVMHNGAAAFAAAGEAGRAFRSRGGIVVLISNAPRPRDDVARQLTRLGVPAEAYDGIVTSGDVTRAMLTRAGTTPAFHLGPERDLGVFADAATPLVAADAAKLIVNTGLFDDLVETPDDYREMLAGFRARKVPMICANPDLKVEKGDKLLYCAGALAEAYAAIGGEVAWAGKPHLPIYDEALGLIDQLAGRAIPKARVLAIGDGLRTDMAGAEAAGLDALFIPSLLHVTPGHGTGTDAIAAEIEALFADRTFRPIGAQLGLRW